MKLLDGVLDRSPRRSLADHLERGGGRGLAAARNAEPAELIDEVDASGLRGRGGGGFPTGAKWRTVRQEASATGAPRVVVNGAEGEPGTFKDRALLRTNPYKVLEGALIAAEAVGADDIVVALKGTFDREIAAVDRAIGELEEVGFVRPGRIRLALGPSEYLFGEETALLEVLAGEQPFPRVAPPYRGGLVDDVSPTRPPTLVNNVETLANVPAIVEHGADEFRRLGTDDSPGTIVCTISGGTRHHGVGEIELGTPLADVIAAIGGGPADGRRLVAALSGVANPIVPADRFETPMTYEDMASIGSGLGAAGFVVYDDETDLVAVARGVARFLAVESCGQCEPCKSDGLALAERFDTLRLGNGTRRDLEAVQSHLATVTEGARCSLAGQQQQVLGSILDLFPDAVRRRVDDGTTAAMPVPVAPIADIRDGRAVLDDRQFAKQPDWSHEPTWGGAWPAQKLADTPVEPPTRSTAVAGAERPVGDAAPAEDTRPFETIADLHGRLDEALSDLPRHPCPQRMEALERLEKVVRVYHDVTQRVLYPIAEEKLRPEQVAPAEEAVGLADVDRRDAEAVLHRLTNDVADDPDAEFELLVRTLRREIDLDREVVIPQLGVGLADRDLEALGRALDEAHAAALAERNPARR
jgi:NADH-quinone oxidoreductase subunit F